MLALVLLVACQSNGEEVKPYEGGPLNIAVVGEIPNVREEQVNFEKLSLHALTEIDASMYDAVFIMENHLSDAANQKYVDMYREKKVPFFFVGSKANTIPFQDLENPVSYEEEAQKVNDTESFISGMLFVGEDEGYRGWNFPYPIEDSEIQRDNVEGIYSEVFKVVEKAAIENP